MQQVILKRNQVPACNYLPDIILNNRNYDKLFYIKSQYFFKTTVYFVKDKNESKLVNKNI